VLEPPDIAPVTIAARLLAEYDLRASDVGFLPLGADVNTAVYRVTSVDGAPYFLKLRRGDFDPLTVAIPHLLHEQGIRQVIPPILTRAGQLSARLDPFTFILYPYLAGCDGYAREMSPAQWRELGSALRGLHEAVLPPALVGSLPHETYTGRWRDVVQGFQALVVGTAFSDPVAAQCAAFLHEQRELVTHMVRRAEELAADLQVRGVRFVLCHGDMHPGNTHLTEDGGLYVVDWDTMLFGPKERDLMAVGMGGSWRGTDVDGWFYKGYGPTEVDRHALAYYRFERIIQDIAAFGEQLLLSGAGGADRAQSLHYLMGSFAPGSVVESALLTEGPKSPSGHVTLRASLTSNKL
jgi:spectinomycin phosphotransferase